MELKIKSTGNAFRGHDTEWEFSNGLIIWFKDHEPVEMWKDYGQYNITGVIRDNKNTAIDKAVSIINEDKSVCSYCGKITDEVKHTNFGGYMCEDCIKSFGREYEKNT